MKCGSTEYREMKKQLHKELTDLLIKDTNNDTDYLQRLLYANQVIADYLNLFSDIHVEIDE